MSDLDPSIRVKFDSVDSEKLFNNKDMKGLQVKLEKVKEGGRVYTQYTVSKAGATSSQKTAQATAKVGNKTFSEQKVSGDELLKQIKGQTVEFYSAEQQTSYIGKIKDDRPVDWEAPNAKKWSNLQGKITDVRAEVHKTLDTSGHLELRQELINMQLANSATVKALQQGSLSRSQAEKKFKASEKRLNEIVAKLEKEKPKAVSSPSSPQAQPKQPSPVTASRVEKVEQQPVSKAKHDSLPPIPTNGVMAPLHQLAGGGRCPFHTLVNTLATTNSYDTLLTQPAPEGPTKDAQESFKKLVTEMRTRPNNAQVIYRLLNETMEKFYHAAGLDYDKRNGATDTDGQRILDEFLTLFGGSFGHGLAPNGVDALQVCGGPNSEPKHWLHVYDLRTNSEAAIEALQSGKNPKFGFVHTHLPASLAVHDSNRHHFFHQLLRGTGKFQPFEALEYQNAPNQPSHRCKYEVASVTLDYNGGHVATIERTASGKFVMHDDANVRALSDREAYELIREWGSSYHLRQVERQKI